MRARTIAVLALASLAASACGGTPRALTEDVAPISQPTPDPTLDAVVRNLPRALAGVAPTPTPVPAPPRPEVPRPAPGVKKPTVAPSVRATATPTRARR
jgi:hypothetical protein